jgi:ATP-binding cassette subfamily B protein/subfamily B ATP-binding cassette protein MsbA
MVMSSWQLTLAFLPFFMLYYLWGPAVERRAAAASKGLAGARVATNQKAYESVSALQELRAYSAENWDLNRYINTVEGWNTNLIRTYFYNYLRISIRTITNYLGALALFVLGVYLVREELMSAGEFIAFFLYYTAAINQMTRFIQNIADQRIVMHQAERVYSFLQTKPLITEPANPNILRQPVRGELLFDNISFSYEPGQLLLKDFTLHIRPGQRVAIVGESGSGKSTLFKLLGRFYDPDKGSILLDGVPINDLSFEMLRNSLGYVFQDTYLFGKSIKENIRFGRPEASDEEIIAAAKIASAHDFIQELPNGYDMNVGERGNKLSGGQRQRIALARLVLKNPTIMLLDEATSALDNRTEYEVQVALDRVIQGRTIIAIAHRLSTIRNYDLIVVMDHGQVVEIGTYEELLAAGGRFSELASSDSRSELEGVING